MSQSSTSILFASSKTPSATPAPCAVPCDLLGTVHVLLARRGWLVNHKRLYRLYRQEHLAVRRLRRKRLLRLSAPIAQLERANQEWSMDFVMDGLATGRALRVLTVVDSYTRECLAMEVDSCLSSRRVTRALE